MMRTWLSGKLVTTFLSTFLLLSSRSMAVGKCVREPGHLNFARYKEPCVVNGYGTYIQLTKTVDTLTNVTLSFDCLLCDQRRYLQCYKKEGEDGHYEAHSDVVKHRHDSVDLGGPIGECDCANHHSKGYVFVFDDSAKQCRGALNSVCDRGVECHTGLECQMGGCTCTNNATGCANIPQPRIIDENSSAHPIYSLVDRKSFFVFVSVAMMQLYSQVLK